jgi:hypothetical protein
VIDVEPRFQRNFCARLLYLLDRPEITRAVKRGVQSDGSAEEVGVPDADRHQEDSPENRSVGVQP